MGSEMFKRDRGRTGLEIVAAGARGGAAATIVKRCENAGSEFYLIVKRCETMRNVFNLIVKQCETM